MKLLLTSDFHLDAVTAGRSRYEDLCIALDEVFKTAQSQSVDMVLFLGDLCDPDPDKNARVVAEAIGFARRLQNAGIKSRWLVGNHDVIEDGSGTSVLEPFSAAFSAYNDVSTYSTPTLDVVQINGVTLNIVALPYTPRVKAYDPVAFIETVQPVEDAPILVIGHLNVPGVVPGSETHDMPRGKEVWLPVDAIQKRWPDACIANGHYHRMQRTESGVYIPGSLECLTFGEEGQKKGCIIVTIDETGWFANMIIRTARNLVTVDEESQVWKDGKLSRALKRQLSNSIVRLRPPSGVSDGIVVALLEEMKPFVHAVKLLPAARSEAVPVAIVNRAERTTHSAVVRELVASAAIDEKLKEALAEVCEDVMMKEGLK